MSAFLAFFQQMGGFLEQMGRNAAILADDVVALAKPAIAAADDIAALSKPAISKASAVVVDDTAVCSHQVNESAIAQQREYTVWAKIVGSSLVNKAVLSTVILSAGAVFPLLPQILLGLGGCYLAIEGAHKVHEYAHAIRARLRGAPQEISPAPEKPVEIKKDEGALAAKKAPSFLDRFWGQDPKERRLLKDLVLLDAILSTEILLVANGLLGGHPLLMQAAAMGIVGVTTTLGVYGAVLGVIRADNVAASLMNPQSKIRLPRVGRGLIRGLPYALRTIGVIGTVAMLGVGGEVLGHLFPQAVTGLGAASLGQALHHGTAAFTHFMGILPAGQLLATTSLGLAAGGLMTSSLALANQARTRLGSLFAKSEKVADKKSAPSPAEKVQAAANLPQACCQQVETCCLKKEGAPVAPQTPAAPEKAVISAPEAAPPAAPSRAAKTPPSGLSKDGGPV